MKCRAFPNAKFFKNANNILKPVKKEKNSRSQCIYYQQTILKATTVINIMLQSRPKIQDTAIQTRTPLSTSRYYKIPTDPFDESVFSLLLPTTAPKLFKNPKFKSLQKSDRLIAIQRAERKAHGVNTAKSVKSVIAGDEYVERSGGDMRALVWRSQA